MSDDINSKSDELTAKFRSHMDLQQAEESLRRLKSEILSLDIQIRKYQQDASRAKLVLDAAEAKRKALRLEEFDLSQNVMRQRRAYIAKSNQS